MMFKLQLILTFFLGGVFTLLHGKAVCEGLPGHGVIEGLVHEEGKNIPVEYANIIVFNPADSSLVTGGLSGPDGSFRIKDIPYGKYYLTID